VPGPDGGYVKFYVMEAAEVLFFDFAEFDVKIGDSFILIDPIVLFCVEPNSLRAFPSPEKSFATARVDGDHLIIRSSASQMVNVMLKGVRKDFAGIRNCAASFAELVDNECRLNPRMTRKQIIKKLAEKGITE
jgi:hypothetical protein